MAKKSKSESAESARDTKSRATRRASNDRESSAEVGKKARANIAALMLKLKGQSVVVRKRAALALGKLGPDAGDAVSALIEAIDDEAVAPTAVYALSQIGPAASDAIPRVVEFILSGGSKTQHAACDGINGLVKLGPGAIPALVKLIQNGPDDVRQYACARVGEFGPGAREAVPALLNSLKCKEQAQLCYSARSLGQIRGMPEKAVPKLMKMLSIENQEVRRQVVTALGEFGEHAAAAVPLLLPILQEKDWFRLFAAEALGKVGPRAAAAIPALEMLLAAPERPIREAAELALSQITLKPLSDTLAKKLAPPPDPNTLDFARTREAVVLMLAEGLAEFSKEHPKVEISCIGLFGQGFGASVSLCLETPEHSSQHVDSMSERDNGTDQLGRFNSSLYDFAFCEYDSVSFDWWPSLYDIGRTFKILMPDGRIKRRSFDKDGNVAIDKPLFELLREILREAWPIKGIRLAKTFRLGVELHDSACVEFWIPK